MIRLDKLLCDLGIGSRSQVKELLKKGVVLIDGEVVKRPETKVDEAHASISVQGKAYAYQKYHYYMLYKPAGVVSATTDKKEQTVLDLMKDVSVRDLFPVGRLDKDTEGLLLLTNHGALAHDMLSPAKHVEKTYLVCCAYPLSEEAKKQLAGGVDIGDDKPTRPAQVVSTSLDTQIELTITEGRYHQIKRMLQAVGNEVTYLKRLRMGTLVLDEALPCGSYRRLTAEEEAALLSTSQ